MDDIIVNRNQKPKAEDGLNSLRQKCRNLANEWLQCQDPWKQEEKRMRWKMAVREFEVACGAKREMAERQDAMFQTKEGLFYVRTE